jgi:hypothetical protein
LISEPMTLITDYALALITGALGLRLVAQSAGQSSRRFWALAFLALALAAALGGTYHGFALEALWKPTVLTIGIASFAMVVGSAKATIGGALRTALIAAAAVKLVLYSLWMLAHDAYIWVVVDTGVALALVALLHAIRWRSAEARWIVFGVALSLAGAAVQASGLALHRNFNHNDLYHVVQAAAMVLYYRGVRRLADRA